MPRKYIRKNNRSVNESDMKRAIKDHFKNHVPVRECARLYHVNRNTLVSRIKAIKIKGKQELYTRETDSGMSSDEEDRRYQNKYTVNQVFPAFQESELANYILKCSSLHYGLSLKQIRLLAFDYAKELVDCKYPQSWTDNNIADYTLWPFWVDTHVTPPFRKENDKIVDSYGSKIKCYPEVPEVLRKLKEQGYELAVASRTSEIKGAKQLMELFGWEKYFTYKEIFPGSKVTHFNNIRSQSKRHFDEMIFFDDESRNVQDITRIGVVSILVRNGVTNDVVDKGIQEYVKERV